MNPAAFLVGFFEGFFGDGQGLKGGQTWTKHFRIAEDPWAFQGKQSPENDLEMVVFAFFSVFKRVG